MTVPLAVRLRSGRLDADITDRIADLSFRSIVPGGFADCSVPLHRPLHIRPDEIDPYARLYVYDTLTGETAWEGRVEDIGRAANDAGEVWELGAVGPSAHLGDIERPLVYVDRQLDHLYRTDTTLRSATGQVSGYTDVDETPAVQFQFPSGSVLATNSRVVWRYSWLREAGMRLARADFRHVEGRAHANLRVQLLTRNPSAAQVTRDDPSATTETGSSPRLRVTDFPADTDLAEVRLIWTGGAATVSDDVTWTSIVGLYFQAARYLKDGTTAPAAAHASHTVLASQIVEDLLVRALPQFDAAGAVVAATSYGIDQAAWIEGASPRTVLDELAELEPGHLYAAWESDPVTEKYRFEYAPWRGVVYEADASQGLALPGSAADVYNEVLVRYRDARGRVLHETRVADVPELTAAGLTRSKVLDISDTRGSLANAQRAGDQFLAEHAIPSRSGTLTVSTPIVDLTTGRLAPPWMVRPGGLIRLTGVDIDPAALDATTRNGQTVFRVVEVAYSQATNTATLGLDAPIPTQARALLAAAGRLRRGPR